jgi:hypothetical protein
MRRWRAAICFTGGAILLLAGLIGFWNAGRAAGAACSWPPPQTVNTLQPGVVAAMDSPLFAYSPGWQVSAAGAGPPEPADPFAQPAGTVTFSYTGGDLYLLLRPGDYWAYLYVSVDGESANRLPVIGGNSDSRGEPAGYRPLLAPERAADAAPLPLLVHRSSSAGSHTVRVEAWRGWGKLPLAGVAIDPVLSGAGCDSMPLWPAALLAVLGAWGFGLGGWWTLALRLDHPPGSFQPISQPFAAISKAAGAPGHAPWPLAASGLALAAASVALQTWWLCAPGLALLALAGLLRPALWLGALLFALPFAFGLKLPLLPGRAFDLIDLGVWGGVAVLAAHWLLFAARRTPADSNQGGRPSIQWPLLALAAVVSWALVSAAAAAYPPGAGAAPRELAAGDGLAGRRDSRVAVWLVGLPGRQRLGVAGRRGAPHPGLLRVRKQPGALPGPDVGCGPGAGSIYAWPLVRLAARPPDRPPARPPGGRARAPAVGAAGGADGAGLAAHL